MGRIVNTIMRGPKAEVRVTAGGGSVPELSVFRSRGIQTSGVQDAQIKEVASGLLHGWVAGWCVEAYG